MYRNVVISNFPFQHISNYNIHISLFPENDNVFHTKLCCVCVCLCFMQTFCYLFVCYNILLFYLMHVDYNVSNIFKNMCVCVCTCVSYWNNEERTAKNVCLSYLINVCDEYFIISTSLVFLCVCVFTVKFNRVANIYLLLLVT